MTKKTGGKANSEKSQYVIDIDIPADTSKDKKT